MSNDVLITPGSRKIEIKDSGGNVDAKIETDASGNLLITNAGGDISIGDTSSDVFIGDGTNNVDIVFEQDGEIRGTSGVTLTLGDANTTLRTGTDLSLNSNDITNVANITTTDMSLSGTMTLTGAIDYTPDNGTLIKFDGQNILTRNTANGAITFGHDDAILITAGDTTAVMNANINEANETIYLGAEGGFVAYAFPNNDTTWSNRKELSWNGSNFAVGGNNVISAAGAWVGSSSGLKGEPGAKGNTGSKGEPGAKGNIGEKGAPGAKGQKGEVGQKGDTGLKGQKGEIGQKGATGEKGAPGEKGQKGQKGDAGAKGATGQKGQKGEVGQKGATGNKGQKGQSHITGSVAGVSNSGWTTAFTVVGSGLGSQVRATFVGTANNVVVNTMADIIVNHSQDILVETKSGYYTLLSLRVISDNNEDFAVQVKTNHANTVTLAVEVFPLNNETVTITTSHSYTGSTYTHDGSYGVKIGGTGGNNGDLRVGGNYYAGTTKVINANGTWAGSSSGLKGEPGAKGQKGEPGAKGQKGEIGVKGITGVKGQKGEPGAKGATGAKGEKGQKGEIGQKGATGNKGQKGEIGLTDAPYGAVPAYSNSNVNSINWNATEEAMSLQSSSNTALGAAFPAFRVNLASNETHKLSVKLKGSTAGSSGIYIRVYEYNAALPSGKVAVSNSASYALVQEDTSGKTNWRENQGVTTSWVTHEYTYTPTSGAQWASIVILNWSGYGTNTLYIRDPMWQLIGSSGAKGATGAKGNTGAKGEPGASVKGNTGAKGEPGASVKGNTGAKGEPGQKGQKGESVTGSKGQKGEIGVKGATGTFSNSSNITVTKALPKIVLDSPSSGDNWTSQGAQISLGESGDGGSAALHLTYRGDGYSYIGSGALSSGIPAYGYLRFQYNGYTINCEANWNIGATRELKMNGTTVLTSGRNLKNITKIINSGSTMIGTTAETGWPINGARINDVGSALFSREAANVLFVNRGSTTRGNQIEFYSDEVKNGQIGYTVPYGGNMYITQGNTSGFGIGLYMFSTTYQINPVTHTGTSRDNQVDLGNSGARFDDVYATNGTIQTSDRNEKQDIQALTTAETAAATACKGLIRRFRWIDSVEEKGDDARYHFGAIAQDVEAAFTAQGLDAGDYGLFIRSTWWEHEGHSYPTAEAAPTGAVEKTRLGIRYNQLFAFIISAL